MWPQPDGSVIRLSAFDLPSRSASRSTPQRWLWAVAWRRQPRLCALSSNTVRLSGTALGRRWMVWNPRAAPRRAEGKTLRPSVPRMAFLATRRLPRPPGWWPAGVFARAASRRPRPGRRRGVRNSRRWPWSRFGGGFKGCAGVSRRSRGYCSCGASATFDLQPSVGRTSYRCPVFAIDAHIRTGAVASRAGPGGIRRRPWRCGRRPRCRRSTTIVARACGSGGRGMPGARWPFAAGALPCTACSLIQARTRSRRTTSPPSPSGTRMVPRARRYDAWGSSPCSSDRRTVYFQGLSRRVLAAFLLLGPLRSCRRRSWERPFLLHSPRSPDLRPAGPTAGLDRTHEATASSSSSGAGGVLGQSQALSSTQREKTWCRRSKSCTCAM